MADEDEFDEDVIIPNSPLSHYLQGLGNSEAANLIEKSSPIVNDDKDCNYLLSETKPGAFSLKAHFSSRCKVLAHLVGSFFYLPYYIFFCASLLSSSLLRYNLNTENELLIREDEAFLESLLKSENVNKLSPVRKLIQIWGLLTTVFFMFYYLIATNKDLFEIFYICYLITCVYAVLSFLCACIVVYCIISDIYFNSFYRRIVQILKLIKRSIRLVQESELTARGFTTASSIGAAERIELSSVLPFNSSNKQCLRLRRCLFKWMKEIFLCYKGQTLTLIQNVPLDPLYDFSTSLAQLEIEEFGAFLTCDLDSSEISRLTDGFSISSLKTMYRLMEMQISEYFRCACVILFFISDNKRKDCCEQIWDLYNIKTTMNVLSKASKPLLVEIGKIYHFYQSIEASYVTDSAPKSPTVVKTPISKLRVTVHNMCLHLKAAMLRAVEIENRLLSTTDSLLPETLQSVDSLMQVVNSELSAFHDCSKESSEIIYDLLHPQKKVSSGKILPAESDRAADDTLPKVVEKCDVEREIEDEVFEAMISTSAADGGRSDRTACQTEDSKKNIEITAHLLSELKNVLVPKADEHRVREQLALAKKSKDAGMGDLEDPSPPGSLQCSVQDATDDACDGNEETDDGKDKMKLESPLNENGMKVDDSIASDVQVSFPNPFLKTNDSFAASIASLAAQRQKLLGFSSDEYVVEGSDYSDSDSSNSD